MSFSSIDFILKFLPLFLIAYFLVPKKLKNFCLIAGSVIFYCFGGWRYFIALFACFLLNLFFVRFFIGRRKVVCALNIILNLAIMVIFRLIGYPIPGLSFVLMEMIALSVDVCSGKTEVKSLFDFATYFFMFPKLLSGPITIYKDIKDQIVSRKNTLANVEKGLGIFIMGLSFKVLLADEIKGVWNGINQIGIDSISMGMAWLGLLAISLNIFFDFEGYSLMAIGVGKMLGFTLPENFDAPYTSKSVSEFYRRWHMTLGNWFKNYIYFPMGGSRVKLPRTLFNLFVVWVATSLWHGFKLHFLAWGMFLCFFILIEKLFWGKVCNKLKVLPHLYLLLVIPLSWLLFFVNNMREALVYVTRLVEPVLVIIGRKGNEFVNEADALKYLSMYAPFMVVGIILCLPKVESFIRGKLGKWYGKVLMIGLFIFDIYMLYINESNPFAYFQF